LAKPLEDKIWGSGGVTLQNVDTIQSTITIKFKEKFCCNEEIKKKIKLMEYKEIIHPKLE
jgi:hypothetical protein